MVARENPGVKFSGFFQAGPDGRQGTELVLDLPMDNPTATPWFHGHVWAARPSQAHFLVVASGLATGKRTQPGDRDHLRNETLAGGVASCSHIPIFHWTGRDGPNPQEFAMIFRYWNRGEFQSSQGPAGILPNPTSA